MDWYAFLRYLVFGIVAWIAVVAVANWLVRTRRISPFSPLARILRRMSDPWVIPVELRVVRAGGNPQHAPWWLLGVAVVAGLLVLVVTRWTVGLVLGVLFAARSGPLAVVRLAVNLAYWVLMLALFVRVVGSWLGVGRFNRWMRLPYALTDWLVKPLQRVIPPIGMIDITPLVAWLVLMIGRALIMSVLR